MKALELLAAAIAAVNALNDELEQTPMTLLRQHNLQTRYIFGGAGSPFAGIGLRPIIPHNKEHERHKAFQTDIDRGHNREQLRKSRMPEPMIWERWPAINLTEQTERDQRLAAYQGSRPKPAAPVKPSADPFENFLRTQARKEARKTKASAEDLMTSPEFRERTKRVWDLINIDLDLDL